MGFLLANQGPTTWDYIKDIAGLAGFGLAVLGFVYTWWRTRGDDRLKVVDVQKTKEHLQIEIEAVQRDYQIRRDDIFRKYQDRESSEMADIAGRGMQRSSVAIEAQARINLDRTGELAKLDNEKKDRLRNLNAELEACDKTLEILGAKKDSAGKT